MPDEDQISCYEKSRDKFKLKCDYHYLKRNVPKHCDWCDDENRDPKCLPLRSIDFDNLHYRLSIVRSMLNFIRDFIDRFGNDLQQNFHSVPIIHVGEQHAQCFETGKALSYMHGDQIDQLIVIAPKFIHLFKHNF